MNYARITYPDLNNGLGCRVTLWLCGCSHNCKGCFNKELQDCNYGKEFTISEYKKLYDILKLPYIKGVTLSGGDPLYQEDIISLCHKIKIDFPYKDIWLYTGYTIDEIKKSDKKGILDYVDTIVDGKFEESKKDLTLPFRGSSNQNIWVKQCHFEREVQYCEFIKKSPIFTLQD